MMESRKKTCCPVLLVLFVSLCDVGIMFTVMKFLPIANRFSQCISAEESHADMHT